MNTVGKILVILNFLFAILVGALLIMNAAIGNKWKDAYEAQLKELTILRASRDTSASATGAVTGDYQRNVLELEAQRQRLQEKEAKWTGDKAEYDLRIATFNEKLDDSLLSLKESVAAQKRQLEEINMRTKTIKDREKLIAKLEADMKVERARAQHSEQQLVTMTARNEKLLDELRLRTLEIVKGKAGIDPGRMKVISPNEPNPPPVVVNGKVEKVDGDLVLISLGTDHNVNKDNTLDIYRLQPESKYLGMIRIVDANNHKSVARLIPSGSSSVRPVLREGDLVTSKLTK
jgi:hypothetical protein